MCFFMLAVLPRQARLQEQSGDVDSNNSSNENSPQRFSEALRDLPAPQDPKTLISRH